MKEELKKTATTEGNSKNNSEKKTEKTTEQNKTKEEKKNLIVVWLKYKNARLRNLMITFLVIAILLLTALAVYYCLFIWLPKLWAWGFDPLTWRAILSVFGAIYLVLGPFLPYLLIKDTISGIIKLSLDEAEDEYNSKIKELEEKQSNYESILKETDTEALIPLVTYSRIELEQYYKIGLSQTQKSYRFSILAMWIGFSIITFGILSYIVPSKIINQDFVNGNFQILTIGSGIVIELISALFLWIYKSSISRSTYFYNRQIFIHNALLAFRISKTIKDPTKAIEQIVEKILEFGISANKDSFLLFNKKTEK